MEDVLILENERKIRIEDIKCPICGERMMSHNGEFSFGDSKLYRRPMSPPFMGYQTRQRKEYESVFKCPDDCCEVKIKHFTDELVM